MPISKENFIKLLAEKFPEDKFEVYDLAGDEDHYELRMHSKNFVGKSKVKQHQYVMNGLKGYVGTTIHALSIKTYIINEQ